MGFKRLFGTILLAGMLASLGTVSSAWGVTARQVGEKAFPSVVFLVLEDANGQPVSMGSGFFVREGVVVTNLHVIEGASGGFAKIFGEKGKYKISGAVGIDTDTELVLLSIEGAKAPYLKLGDSGQVEVGDEISAIGNPLGLEGTFSAGIVSGVRIVGENTILQVTAPISPGCNGGPMLDTQGEVIGVSLAIFQRGRSLNFAVPSYYLKSLLSKTTVAQSLFSVTRSEQSKSAFASLGERGLEGVEGGQFAWTYATNYGEYTFSLHNRLTEHVYDVECLVVFYDQEGYPIDFDSIEYKEGIPPQLAKRVRSRVDGSVQQMTGGEDLARQVRVRVLDFRLPEAGSGPRK